MEEASGIVVAYRSKVDMIISLNVDLPNVSSISLPDAFQYIESAYLFSSSILYS